MVSSVFVLPLFFTGILSCQWVCIDNHNNIKRRYFDKNKLKVEYSSPTLEVPVQKKISTKVDDYLIPEVTLRMPSYQVEPVQVSCKSDDFKRTVKDITKKIKCAPRETIVDIVYDGGKVTPNKVSTKLCSGVCSGTKVCLSTDRRNVSLSVRTILNDGQVQCSTVMVPEDTKCKCDCDIQQSNCLATQSFEKKFCKCKCNNEVDYIMCQKKISNGAIKKFRWNPQNCTCQCLHEKVCTTGTVWNKDECRCERIMARYNNHNHNNKRRRNRERNGR